MNVDQLNQIKQIATQTRRWAMRNRQRAKVPSTLMGMCAIAAGELWSRLTKAGIQSKIAIRNVMCEGHCFVIVGEYLVDITATQFNGEMKAVEIRHRAEARKQYNFWRCTKIHDTANQLKQHQARTGWPNHQIVWTE